MTLSGQEVPSGYVYVHPRADMCVHLHVSGEDRAKSARQPLLSSPPAVCALPSRQSYVKTPLSVSHMGAKCT